MRIQHPTRSIFSIAQIYRPHRPQSFPRNLLPIFGHRTHFFTRPASSSSSSSVMAGESESFSTAAEDTAKYGFERDEMYLSSLSGTVESYERHLFLCYKSHDTWPPRVEDSDSDPFPKLLASALKARKNDISVKTRLTICESGNGKFSDGDVLIFPEMTVCRGLTESDVDSFIEDVLVNGKPWLSGVQGSLAGSYVFVCAHNKRDRRCGVCGPILIEKFKEEIGSKDLKDQVFVAACSHVGGHKYAGNVITFSADPGGKIAGNWYGYVTPNDVIELLDKQVGKGEVIDRIWRGQMGAKAKEDEQVEESKHATETSANVNDKQLTETATKVEFESVGSCCQGVNGFSCCRAENVEKKQTKNGCSSWAGKFEQHHVLITVAVVGAVASIAVAYSLYRKAR